jgi:hypothetical protein
MVSLLLPCHATQRGADCVALYVCCAAQLRAVACAAWQVVLQEGWPRVSYPMDWTVGTQFSL